MPESQFRFVGFEFDPNDPGGFLPDYGNSTDIRVLHVTNPDDPDLDTFFYYHLALEVPIAENPDTLAAAPPGLIVNLIAFGPEGDRLDAVENIILTRFDDAGDPFFINYRSDVAQPLIFVDTAVDKSAFPDLDIVQVDPAGFVTVFKR